MDSVIKLAIKQPIAVAAFVFLIIAFGIVSLQKIPIQMTPDIDKPVLQVRVSWPGASPEDVEREVVTRIELAVTSLTGVENIESDSRFGSARVTLTYSVGQDMDIALIQLLSKVSSIDGLPFESKRPTVKTSNSDDSPISRLAMVKLPNSKIDDLGTLGDFVEFEIIEKLSRIEGISEITFRGGQKKELKVALDTQKLAEYSISIPSVLEALKASSAQVTAGEIIEGKYVVGYLASDISGTFTDEKYILKCVYPKREGSNVLDGSNALISVIKDNMIPYHTQAIKELHQIVITQSSLISGLQTQILDLSMQVASLSNS